MNKKFATLSLLLFLSHFVFAQDVAEITAPINKIYDLVKSVVSILGIIAITIAGAYYMFSGSNIQARENAKSMVAYSVVGLVLVWVAPLIVIFLSAPPAP